MAHENITRELQLPLGTFALESLSAEARRHRIPLSRLVQQAVRYYESQSCQRAATVPRLDAEAPAGTVTESIELRPSEWNALERAAKRNAVRVEEMICHAALLFLADLDSGQVAAAIARDEKRPG